MINLEEPILRISFSWKDLLCFLPEEELDKFYKLSESKKEMVLKSVEKNVISGIEHGLLSDSNVVLATAIEVSNLEELIRDVDSQ